MRENVRRVNASVIPVHGSACPVERQQSCQEGERGRRELEKGLGKKYDLGRFLGPPKFKKPNTKPNLPLLLIAMRAGEIEIDGPGIGAQSPPLPTSYEMRFAQPGRDKTTCRLHSF